MPPSGYKLRLLLQLYLVLLWCPSHWLLQSVALHVSGLRFVLLESKFSSTVVRPFHSLIFFPDSPSFSTNKQKTHNIVCKSRCRFLFSLFVYITYIRCGGSRGVVASLSHRDTDDPGSIVDPSK